jgi:hypothetical protein
MQTLAASIAKRIPTVCVPETCNIVIIREIAFGFLLLIDLMLAWFVCPGRTRSHQDPNYRANQSRYNCSSARPRRLLLIAIDFLEC